MQFEKNIFLTGFMGSGKTTAGEKLAKLLNKNFVDLDKYIEQHEKISIQDLFENFGEPVFRKIEQRCLNEVFEKQKQAVISLGGGTICYEDNLEKVKNAGILIYLELPAVTLVQRIENSKVKRPLLKNLTGKALLDFVNDKLKEREKFYNSAHICIPGLNLTPQLLQQKISEYQKEHN